MNILDFEPLVRKYTWNKNEDVKSEAWLAVVEAFANFDLSKGVHLAGYVESCVKYAVWNMVKKEQRYKWRYLTSETESYQNKQDVIEEVEKYLLRREIYNEINNLSVKQKQAIKKIIILGYSLKECAKEAGSSAQAIFNLKKSGINNLKKALERIYIGEG